MAICKECDVCGADNVNLFRELCTYCRMWADDALDTDTPPSYGEDDPVWDGWKDEILMQPTPIASLLRIYH